MAAHNPELRRLAARAGAAATNGATDLNERRAELAEARLANHIRKVCAAAPPLTDAQRDRLAAIIRPGTAGGTGEGRVAS